MRRIAAILLAAAWPAAASALDCASAKTQFEINQCADRDFRKADAALNQVYARLKARTTDPNSRKRLVAAEGAWLAYRDRECDFETEDSIGGSIRTMELALCYREKTVARAAELRKQLDCPEGDLTCAR
ncbi:MAG TPA: lysozyme inhibitor LprI family protein [Stellaceae bacterium]|nr:lysozyme inhibitor LprI family protein [Stellaceae bacterium]